MIEIAGSGSLPPLVASGCAWSLRTAVMLASGVGAVPADRGYLSARISILPCASV
jgi:hypothetical protein